MTMFHLVIDGLDGLDGSIWSRWLVGDKHTVHNASNVQRGREYCREGEGSILLAGGCWS